MDLLKQLKPFKKELDAWDNSGTFPKHQTLEKLAKVWDVYKVKNYKKCNAGTSKTNLGCTGCIRDMIKGLTAWRRFHTEDPTVHFKGIPEKVKEIKIETIKIIDYSKMKFMELKKLAKEKGMKLQNTTKKTEIVTWLNNL